MLPINEVKEQIITALNSSNSLIIKAPTGSGKSTQVPQIIMENLSSAKKILVLQPRRIAARFLAMRVAEEVCCKIGDEVGFQTRFEKSVSVKSRIIFITEGILPRMLMNDPILEGVGAIIFDEFHERSLTIDFSLSLVKELQRTSRTDLKIIIMSATMQTGKLKEFLSSSVEIVSEGKCFPVHIEYSPVNNMTLWDASVIGVRKIIEKKVNGDILIFMPGAFEIRKTISALKRYNFGESLNLTMLHGDLSIERQNDIMRKADKRKIIVSTNIAETSLTISGVRHVIDSGYAKVNRYDSLKGINTLGLEKIATDSAEQRAGRAGREGEGFCIRLWSQIEQAKRDAITIPEIKRVDLSEMVLQIIRLNFSDIFNFPYFDHPENTVLSDALDFLLSIGLITKDCKLTDRGRIASELPMHPRISSLLIESQKQGVLRSGAFTAAVLSERPFISGAPDFTKEMLASSNLNDFNLLSLVAVEIIKSNYDDVLVRKYNINVSALKNIFRTMFYFLKVLKKAGITYTTDKESNTGLSKAILSAYSDRIARRIDAGTLICEFNNGFQVELSKESAARKAALIVPTMVRLITGKNGRHIKLAYLACGIEESWLREMFSDYWSICAVQKWNSIKQLIEEIEYEKCLGLLIHKRDRSITEFEKAGALLAETIIEKKLPMYGWDNQVKDFLNRLGWARIKYQIDNNMSDDENYRNAVLTVCSNQYRYEDVKKTPLKPILIESLSIDDLHRIETASPEYFENNNQRYKVYYSNGRVPFLRIALEDCTHLKLDSSPEQKFEIEIIAPDNKVIATTSDIEHFKCTQLPDLIVKMRKKYPKRFLNC
jgi:ATP-dependent helicase HrpB